MKLCIYAAIFFALIGLGWLLYAAGRNSVITEMQLKQAEHKIETEKLKRGLDKVNRRLRDAEREKLAASSATTSDKCYRLDDPLPPSLLGGPGH